MNKLSLIGGLSTLALCLAGCGSNSAADAAASESAMAGTGMASDDVSGATTASDATAMPSEAGGMGAASSEPMGTASTMASEGAMNDAEPVASSSPASRKAAGQAGQ